MKSDWDRRIDHDYRFWMSDGWSSDAVMWESGERDLALILEDLEIKPDSTFLEVGCGVGRLLRAASKRFSQTYGIDVSEKAISKAQKLLADCETVSCICGNGVDLALIPDDSIDCVISFAALTSMPTEVIACYLLEMRRVLKSDGVVRLQVYLGQEQAVRENDTLHLRCYRQNNFMQAIAKAGFELEWIRELRLPFQVSFKEVGIEAVIVSLHKSDVQPAEATEIARMLLPEGETQPSDMLDGDALEYWMTVNYAKELAEQGDIEKARDALQYAEVVTRTMSIDVQDSLQTLVAKLEEKPGSNAQVSEAVQKPYAGQIYERNMRCLLDRFPEIAAIVADHKSSSAEIKVTESLDGPVLLFQGQCVDHMSKPVSAGRNWAKQALQNSRVQESKRLVIFGFGCGYHIEELQDLSSRPVSAIEPSIDLFIAALGARDLVPILTTLEKLAIGDTVENDFFDETSELLVRPQAQSYASDQYRAFRSRFYGVRGLATLRPKIAVLGPVMGGTLPIMSYSSRALAMLNQRVREIDMSGFATGYNEFSKLIGNELLRASAINQYVETLSKTIVNSVTEKPIDILLCMAQAPITPEALIELRKRGVITVLWFVEDYLRFTSWQQMAGYYDFIFTIQRGDCIEKIKAAGCPEVHYLPTACDPAIHGPRALSPEEHARWGSPVSFLGAGYHNRQQMFASLANYPFKIWGTEWPTCKPFDRLVQEQGRRLKPEEYVNIFNATKININLHSSTERDGIDPAGDFLNPRTFELASCGAFQLIDPRQLLGEIFTPGKDIVTFDSTEDLKDKINYYLEHDTERQDIAQAARHTVLQNHTYQHRIRDMLSIIYSSKYEQLRSREDANPWRKIITASRKYPELQKRCQLAFDRGEEATLDALVSDVVTGKGELTDVEMKLLFLFHVSKQMIHHKREENGG